MKKYLIYFILFLFCLPILAMDMDESVDYILNHGYLMDNGDQSVLMHDSYQNEEYPDIYDAYTFLSEAAYVLLVLQADWEDISDEDKQEALMNVDQVAVPYDDMNDLEIIYINLYDLLDYFATEEYYEMDNDELFDEVSQWVDDYALDVYYDEF